MPLCTLYVLKCPDHLFTILYCMQNQGRIQPNLSKQIINDHQIILSFEFCWIPNVQIEWFHLSWMNSVCWHFALTFFAVFRRILQYSIEFHLISLNSTVLVYRIIVQVQQTLHNLVNQYTSVESCVYRFQLLSWCSVPFFSRIRPNLSKNVFQFYFFSAWFILNMTICIKTLCNYLLNAVIYTSRYWLERD